jgi:uroporphyrinogen-III synthase
MPGPSFGGLRVLALESRRATETAALISNLGGEPIVAPSLKEVPLESNTEAIAFAERLLAGEFDLVILLTGVGTRVLIGAVAEVFPPARFEAFIRKLSTSRIAARGPKPVAALRERGLVPWAVAPEPNTWRELVAEIEVKGGAGVLRGARVAVQEYGVSNPDLIDALRTRGASVTRVPTYAWALPDDLEPMRGAIRALVAGEVDVVIFMSGIQRVHLQEVADAMGLGDDLHHALSRCVVASIGPSATAELVRHGSPPDLEASHPKMGVLVREAAERGAGLLDRKRAR